MESANVVRSRTTIGERKSKQIGSPATGPSVRVRAQRVVGAATVRA
jgi:hypothetical protein